MTIPPEDQLAFARSFSGRSGRGFGGGFLDERVVRGIVFARLADFVEGNAKVRPIVAERVAALLDLPLPLVPLDGQVGAGEVLPMRHVTMGLSDLELEEGEGMALINGSPASSALLADAALHAAAPPFARRAALRPFDRGHPAPLDAYDEVLESLWGDEQETAALRALRGHLEGAETEHRLGHQAPVSYRIVPRVLGQARRAVEARGACRGRRAPFGHPESRLRAAGRGSPARASPLDGRLPQRRGPGGARDALARLGRAGARGRAPGHRDASEQRLGVASFPQSSGLRARFRRRRHEPVRLGRRLVRRRGAGRRQPPRCCPRASTIPRTTCPRRPSAPTARSAGRRSASRRPSRSSPSSRARRSTSPTAGRRRRSSLFSQAVRSLFAPVDGTVVRDQGVEAGRLAELISEAALSGASRTLEDRRRVATDSDLRNAGAGRPLRRPSQPGYRS